MKFLEIITGGCLLNVAEIVSIYEVVNGLSSFPIRLDDERYPETGLYFALKVGLECQALPLVMLSTIKSIAGNVLNECESRHYLEAQQKKDRHRARRVVTDMVLGIPLQQRLEVADNRPRGRQKFGKARIGSADKAPQQPEGDKTGEGVAGDDVNITQLLGFRCNESGGKNRHQRPVKQPRRQVPDAETRGIALHEDAHFGILIERSL